MVASGVGFGKTLIGTGWAIFLLLCTTGLRKQSSGLVGLPFLTIKLFLSLHGWSLAKSCNEWVWSES